MRLSGYAVPGESTESRRDAVGSALFDSLTEDEREELIEYLAWYRTRRRSHAGVSRRR